MWAVVTFSFYLGSFAAMFFESTEQCAAVIGSIGCLGGMAWFATANYFVLRQ